MNTYYDNLSVYAALQGGKLLVHHPPDGPYPVVVLGPGVKLQVNEREYLEINQPIPVTVHDHVVVTTLTEESEGSWSLEVTPDNMVAILKLKPYRRIRYVLKDSPPARILRLEGIPIEEVLSPVTLGELTDKLRQLGVVHGIDWETIRRLFVNPEEKEVIIARGTPPEPGQDAKIELLFSLEEKIKIEGSTGEKVDLLQRFVYTSAVPGQVLARKHPAQPGKPGRDLKGNIILPPEPQDVSLKAGEGTTLTKEGLEVVAAKPGRPVAIHIPRGMEIKIINVLHHDEDVDKSSGHIIFAGDIIVKGNVLEGMRVEAGESAVIEGTVSGASIKAQDSVVIKGNVHASTIIAGEKFALLRNGLPLLKRISSQIEELFLALNQLKEKYTGSTIGPLVKLLLERKYPGIPASIQVLREYVKKLPFEYPPLTRFLNNMEYKLVRLPLAIVSIEEVEELYNEAMELLGHIQIQDKTENGNVTVGYVLNSKIIASGSVTVSRIGCDNSYIEAGKKVIIHGAFRGGEIKAGEEVYVKELGTRGGAKSAVTVQDKGVVTIEHAYENSFVKIGVRIYPFTREERKIRLRLNADGEIEVIPLR